MKTYLSTISSCTKSLKSVRIEDLDVRADQHRLFQILKYDGYANCFIDSANNLVEMARNAVLDFFEKESFTPAEIDGIVFCSDSISNGEYIDVHEGEISPREMILKMLWDDFSLKNATLSMIGLKACANFASSVLYAASALHQGKSTILVILTESRPIQYSRIPRFGTYLYSDMAIAFVVSKTRGTFVLNNIALEESPAMFQAFFHNKNLHQGLEMMRCIQRLKDISRRWDEPIGSTAYEIVISDNLSSMTSALVARGIGEDSAPVLSPTKRSLGHAFSMDCPMSLMHMNDTGELASGKRLLLLNVGPWAVGALSILRV